MLIEVAIILFIVLLIAAFFIFKLSATLIGGLFKLIGLAFLFAFIIALIILADAYSFNSKFQTESNAFYLRSGDQLIAGFIAQGTSNFVFQKQPALDQATRYYRQGESKALLQGRYKVIVIDMSAFDTIQNLSITTDLSVSRNDLPALFSADNIAFVRTYLHANYVTNESTETFIRDIFESDSAVLKGWVYARLIQAKTDAEGKTFLIYGFKQGTIEFFDETPLFTFLRYMPESLIRELKLAA